MTELAVTLLRLSYLALLWVFVLVALWVRRRDVFGTRVTCRARPRGPARARRPGPARPATAPTPPPRKERPARHPPTRLVVTRGPLSGTTLPLGPSAVLVGRAPDCTLVLDDDYAAGRHARLFPHD